MIERLFFRAGWWRRKFWRECQKAARTRPLRMSNAASRRSLHLKSHPPPKVIHHQKSSATKSHPTPKVIHHQKSSTTKRHPPPKVIHHQKSSKEDLRHREESSDFFVGGGNEMPCQEGPASTSHQSGITSSFSIAFMCTTSRWIPASAGTNQGPEKCDLIPL